MSQFEKKKRGGPLSRIKSARGCVLVVAIGAFDEQETRQDFSVQGWKVPNLGTSEVLPKKPSPRSERPQMSKKRQTDLNDVQDFVAFVNSTHLTQHNFQRKCHHHFCTVLDLSVRDSSAHKTSHLFNVCHILCPK